MCFIVAIRADSAHGEGRDTQGQAGQDGIRGNVNPREENLINVLPQTNNNDVYSPREWYDLQYYY